MNRFVFAIFTSALLVLSGCQRASEKPVITLWHQMTPGERAVLEEQLLEFERDHGVSVNTLYKETEELRSGFEAAALAGIGPELIFGPSDNMQLYLRMGIVRDMQPWFEADELREFREDSLTILPIEGEDGTSQTLVQIGDRVGNHLALVYNRDFVKTPPKTTDELIEIGKRLTRGEGKDQRYGLVWNNIEPFFAIPFLTGHGAWVFDETDGTKPNLATPESAAAYQLILDLEDKHKIVPASCNYELAHALFKDGKAAMIINGDWSWNEYLSHEGIDAAIAPLPIVSSTGKPMGPMVATKGYSLNANAVGEQADLAMQLVRYLTSEEVQLRIARKLKTVPSRITLLENEELLNDETLAVSIEQMKRGRAMPNVPELRAVWDAMRPHYQALLGGEVTAEEAASLMQRDALHGIELMNRDILPGPRAGLFRWFGGLLGLLLLASQWKSFRAFLIDFPRNKLAYIFVIPAFLVIIATVVFPFVFNIVLSCSNMSVKHLRDWEVIGFQSYLEVLSDSKFLPVFAKTIVWTVVNVFFHVVIGVTLAVALNGPVRGKRIYRLLLIIPWAIPAYITALTWQGMFDLEYGAVNLWLSQLGIPRVDWLGNATWTFVACLITNIWLGFPFMMVIALGGMQSIPQELYEAASIDRASKWHQFWHITVPMLKPVLLPAITLGVIWTFNKLDVIWLVSDGGRPNDETHILVSYVYKAVFNLYRYGYGAALSMVIFAILLVFSIVFMNRTEAAEAVQ